MNLAGQQSSRMLVDTSTQHFDCASGGRSVWRQMPLRRHSSYCRSRATGSRFQTDYTTFIDALGWIRQCPAKQADESDASQSELGA